jgi:hypothetical protein
VSTAYPLPDVRKVQDILGMLFDGLDVKPGGKFDDTPNGGAWFGVFIDDVGAPVALCGADVSLAAGLSAALSMLPPAAAKEAARSRELSGAMCENLREVMNICTRLVLDSASAHLKLDQIYPVKALPEAASAVLAKAPARREFDLQLPRYGGGVLSLRSTR